MIQAKEKIPLLYKKEGDNGLSQGCDKGDWRLFYLGAGESVGLVPAEDEDLAFSKDFGTLSLCHFTWSFVLE